jgi:hypothetical protein
MTNRVNSQRKTAPEYILFSSGNKQKIKNSVIKQNEALLPAWYSNNGPYTLIVSSEAWNYYLLWLVSRFTQGLLIGWKSKMRRPLAWPRSLYCDTVHFAYWDKAGSILSSEHHSRVSPGNRSCSDLVRQVPFCGSRLLLQGLGRLLSNK